jgi:D-alanyl-D-alanine carboxypeptidase/D-alanyl-D-alanine-endopeptidase (penicillin-binding protein 4)
MIISRRTPLLFVLFVAATMLLPVVVAAVTLVPSQPLLSQFGFADEDVGFILFDPTTSDVLEAHRADEPRIPASTTKVTTMIAALKILGAEYHFPTTLYVSGEIKNKTLHGNLYLRGGGDPTLTTDDLRTFLWALRRANIKRVSGDFIFDQSLLTTLPAINPQQPVAVSYNPGLSALSVNYNRILLRWKHKPSNPAFTASVVSPAEGGVVPINAISTGLLPRSFDRRIQFLLDGKDADRWLLSPFLPPQGVVDLPVKTDPGRITALLFQMMCRQRGIDLPLPQPGVVPAEAREFSIVHSKTLSEVAAGVLRYSNNLAAELIGQVATRTLSERPLSLAESAGTQVRWYQQTLPKTDWRGFFSANHSGLSTATRHSPRQLAAILRYGWSLSVGPSTFPQLLSPPHWERDDEQIRQRVRAKSGTMDYADGLVGFLTTARGRELGFVILLTDFAKRAELDATYDVRLTQPQPQARDWTERAKAFERALVGNWITRY